MNNNMDVSQILQSVRNNSQMMGNNTVSNVFNLRDKKDRQGLIEVYKNTCKTMGCKPDKRFLQ